MQAASTTHAPIVAVGVEERIHWTENGTRGKCMARTPNAIADCRVNRDDRLLETCSQDMDCGSAHSGVASIGVETGKDGVWRRGR